MTSDWFEKAISELDDGEADSESGEHSVEDESEHADETPEEKPVDADSAPETAQVDSGDDADTAGGDDNPDSKADSAVDEADNAVDEDGDGAVDEDGDGAVNEDDDGASDPFGFDDEDDTAAGDGASDPFGFGSDDTDEDSGGEAEPFGPDAQSGTEFDAETGDDNALDGASGEADDESTVADSPPEPSARTESSMAQSPDEFGFSLDETEDSPSADGAESDAFDPMADHPTDQPTDQAVDQPTDQMVDQPTNQPAAQPTDQPAAQPTDQSTDQPDDDPFGFGASGGGGSTPAMDSGGDDEFGFGGFGGGGGGGGGGPTPSSSEEFDDEAFESDIDRIDLGIEGLDDMILGGVPERSLIGIIGGAGTGKTTFGLQFLNQALTQGERAVFITLEQTEEAVLSTAEEKGWPFREYVENDQLVIVVLDPVEMANSLASIRGDISRLIREFGASRLVLDSVSLLEMMYDHPAKRRSEIFDFTRTLKEAGVTTLLTSEASEDSSHASRYGAVEYLTDAVFILRYVRTSNFEETRLAIEIQKIRDANHSRATKPYDLTDEGMSVHRQANIF